MANTDFLGEGASLARPPAFNGSAYMYWKERMLIFLEASGLDILDAVENGPFIPRIAGTDGNLISKPRSDWSDDDKKRVGYNAKAKNIITSALSADEFFRVSNCKTAKEMWDTLQETHEGTTDVKRARTNTLMHEFELFNMKKDETISDLQTRFTHVINNLNALGKKIDNEQQISKIMRCLTREWQPKTTAIAESRDLSSMTIATLFGKLREHEMELRRLNDSEQMDKRRKGLSLKAQIVKSESENSSDDSQSEDQNEPEIGLLVKKFKKFLKNKGGQQRKMQNFKSKNFNKAESSEKQITCYECGKQGHIKSECFQLQNKNKFTKAKGKDQKFSKPMKKAYIAWDENDVSSESSEEEEANLCLMANSDSNSDTESEVSTTSNPSYEELHDAFNELHDEYVKVVKQFISNKKILAKQCSQFADLKKEHETITKMYELEKNKAYDRLTSVLKLEEKVRSLESDLAQFTSGRKNLNALLGNQKHASDKSGIGYRSTLNVQKKNIFVRSKQAQIRTPYSTCNFCSKDGHKVYDCELKKLANKGFKQIWKIKDGFNVTNPQGPKKIWVPKPNQ